ncbi:MAG: hypothetical protein ACI85I_000867, partial [Arenicella sp.]
PKKKQEKVASYLISVPKTLNPVFRNVDFFSSMGNSRNPKKNRFVLFGC